MNPFIIMHYILLVYEHAENWAQQSKDEKNRIHEACGAWHDKLVKSGHARSAMGLHPVSTATTVRQKKEKPILTDGPFAETKEVLGGFEVIECKDQNEAVEIAKTFPALRLGFAMEVRQLRSDGCHED